jgi:SpoVK/Ycf46/Vps4 family AAA+-type ATPase
MYHTIIFGCPGVGKTAFAKILARIYLSLGITKKDVFVTARRSDLVGEYLGHTAVKTQKKIDESIGGVLFIDEAYSLGSSTETKTSDSYSKECIDTLNQNLTEKKGQFICIIAGYKDEIEKNLFSVNPGLRRRFSFAYTIKGYSDKELAAILALKIKNIRWVVTSDCEEWLVGGSGGGEGSGKGSGFFSSRMESFPNFAGDVETLLLNIKIAHARRTFGKEVTEQKSITRGDVELGYSRYLAHRGLDNVVPTPWKSMYS